MKEAFDGNLSTPALENISEETARLEALRDYHILDTLPEAAFDSITKLATRVFQTPICLVSLLDNERQWFKSSVGMNVRETPREIAFCRYTILSDEVLVVSDATQDARFASHDAVTGEPAIRFYAGAPLITPKGVRIGTLCVVDTRPREFDEEARTTLRELAGLVMDELELRRAQHALSDNAGYFRALIENAGDIIVVLADDGTILFESPSIQNVLGYAPEELIGRNAFVYVHPEDVDKVQERFNALSTSSQSVAEVEFRFKHRDGSWHYLEARGTRLPESAAQSGIVVNSRDVSERKATQHALRESEARHGAVIDTALDAILTMNADSTILEWNPAAERIFGYTREEAIGRNMYDLIVPPALRTAHQTGMAHYLDTWEKHILDKRIEVNALQKDGSKILVELIATRLPTAGAPIFTGFMRDITHSKRSEERLRLLESVAVHANDSILITEAEPITGDGPRILYANPAFTRETGYSLEEVLGKTPRILQGPESDQVAITKIRVALEKWEAVEVELVNYKKDGTKFWVEISIVPVCDENGWYTHWVSVQRIITERKIAQQQLQHSKEAAELSQRDAQRANAAKSEFLSRMSHELRTPLNAILGFAQVMQMDPLDGEQHEMVSDIMSAGKHLLTLINEVLDIARIESGHLALSPEPVAIGEIVSGAVNLIAPLAAARGLTLDTTAAIEAEGYVLADRQRLSQCLLNLLSNAVKYNRESGCIEVSCHQVPHENGVANGASTLWRIEVRDSGVGIAPEKMARLFTAFDRLDAERGDIEGTGLGLALTKQLVEAMNGKLRVTSTPGEGSIFAIELPLCEPSLERSLPSSLSTTKETSRAKSTVLCIEDNPHNLKVVSLVLSRRPHIELLKTQNGQSGLEAAALHLPDLILLDLHLPDINGREVLQRLKDNPATRAIPVVILSADATLRQMEDLRAAGAREYLTKPFDVTKFLEKIDEILL